MQPTAAALGGPGRLWPPFPACRATDELVTSELPVTRPELRNAPTIRSMAVSLGEFGLGSEVGVDVGDIQVSNRDLGTQFRATDLLETWGTRRN